MIILGIESSCDETAAAIVIDGSKKLSSVVSSQVKVHKQYGGVVPELASRKHLEAIIFVTQKAIEDSGLNINQINAIAVTKGPGLIGSLLVGFSFAKSLAFSLNISWIGLNHLEGHVSSLYLNEENTPPFPFVTLLASGGHTNIYFVKSHTSFELLGQTRDDAAGEAYDKVAKMLDLGYPGGKIIDDLAKLGDPNKIKFPRSYLDKKAFDFSFSGIKTAVSRYVQEKGIKPTEDKFKQEIYDILASFQEAVTDVLTDKLINAAIKKNCSNISIVGGVAANSNLRQKIKTKAKNKNFKVYMPTIELCGDNAAMIAALGYYYLKDNKKSCFNDDVYSRIRLK